MVMHYLQESKCSEALQLQNYCVHAWKYKIYFISCSAKLRTYVRTYFKYTVY